MILKINKKDKISEHELHKNNVVINRILLFILAIIINMSWKWILVRVKIY